MSNLRNRLKRLETDKPAEEERIIVQFLYRDEDGVMRYEDGSVVDAETDRQFKKGATSVIVSGETGGLRPRRDRSS